MSDAVREGNTGGEERGAGPHVALPAQGVTAREAAALAAAAGAVWLAWRTGGSLWLLPPAMGLLAAVSGRGTETFRF